MGEGGVGVLVGGGGRSKYDGSTNEYSDVSSGVYLALERVSDDSDVGEGGYDESSVWDKMDDRVIVSARGRVVKRPLALGCVFQASVIGWWVFEMRRARCCHDAAVERKHKRLDGR